LPYLLAERVAFIAGIEPAFETSVDEWFVDIFELCGPRHVNVVCVVLVDLYVQVVTRQSPSLESGDQGVGASFDDGVTRFGGGATLPCHVLKRGGERRKYTFYLYLTYKRKNVIFPVGRRRRIIMNRINNNNVPSRKDED
jgi:hypothetical protein